MNWPPNAVVQNNNPETKLLRLFWPMSMISDKFPQFFRGNIIKGKRCYGFLRNTPHICKFKLTQSLTVNYGLHAG
ncbi:MAG: hypothetical protein CML57_10435 [Rhodobacteraceae bacterium]|nr:hypothetical protein [Paracoccaceae bacterium]HCJ62001.1 hypothetical protein [Alphaproteobacteria bacterium]